MILLWLPKQTSLYKKRITIIQGHVIVWDMGETMRLIKITGLVLTLLTLPAFAGDFEDGAAASDRGDYATALRLWQPLAEQGNAGAQYNLGQMYRQGKGVAQDYKEALKWFRLAAAQGVAEAQYNLGVMYAKGDGVAPDYVRAHMWSNLAASAFTGEKAKTAANNRDMIAEKMTPTQIEKAQEMARRCEASHYKNCD